MEKMDLKDIKMTKRKVLEIAKKAKTLHNFYYCAYPAYKAAKEKGWYDDVKKLIGQRHSMTKEECHKIALLYSRPSEWDKGNPRSYSYAKRLGWIPELTKHMSRIVNFTNESCAQIALLYENRNDFAKQSPSAYAYACRNNILDEVCAHMKPQGSKSKRIIYVYEFEDHHAYVGLTYNLKRRKQDHMTNPESPVFRYKSHTHVNYEFKTLSDWISEEKASILEEKMIKEYESNGWQMLNTMRGGGLGACRKKITLEYCKQVASGYHYKKHFMEEEPVVYQTVHQNGWQTEVFAHMSKWTKCKERYPDEKIREIIADCKIREDIKRLHNPLYQYLLRNNLLDKYMPNPNTPSHPRHPQGYWTLENAIKVVKLCNSRTEMRKKYYQAYILLKDNGLLDKYLPSIKGKRPNKKSVS